MNIDQLNRLNETKACEAFEQCCGASRWIDRMVVGRPYEDLNEMLEISDRVWEECDVDDYQEAFEQLERTGLASAIGWAGVEAGRSSGSLWDEFLLANHDYRDRFGHIFVACATGRPLQEILKLLRSRMENGPEQEILIAAAEQNKLTRMRLKKLLHTAADRAVPG